MARRWPLDACDRCYGAAMVSARLNSLVTDLISRTYLTGNDGYWADLVLAEFGFLEERGGRLDEIHFHQQGDFIRYVGPWGAVVLEFFPDNYPNWWIGAEARLSRDAATFEGQLDRLVHERMPDTPDAPLAPLDHETIAANVRRWAAALRGAVDLI